MPKRKTTADDSPSFEQALSDLEAIVEAMENQQLPLEQLVQAYEQGSRLLQRCDAVLRSARQRLETIDLRSQSAAAGDDEVPAADAPASGPDSDDDDIRLF